MSDFATDVVVVTVASTATSGAVGRAEMRGVVARMEARMREGRRRRAGELVGRGIALSLASA